MTSAISSRPGKLILAVETSTSLGSLALLSADTVIEQTTWERQGSHSEFVTAHFCEILRSQKISAHDIDCIAVGVGPGSFTGIRVAVNFARALAFGLKKPVFTMNSLGLLVHQPSLANHRGHVFVVQYGFRDIFYGAEYYLDQSETIKIVEVQKPRAITARDLAAWIPRQSLVIGAGALKLKDSPFQSCLDLWEIRPANNILPEAAFFSRTLVAVSKNPPLTDWIHTVPLYIRASEAEEKLRSSAF